MKLITAALLSALSCYTELAAAATGHVLISDPTRDLQDQPSTEKRTLSPETARLVLAQRAGVEDYHVEKALSEGEIQAINDYGTQTQLLGADKDDSHDVFILAFVNESMAKYAELSSFDISPAPSASETEVMFRDLANQNGQGQNTWEEIESSISDYHMMESRTPDGKRFVIGKMSDELGMMLEGALRSSSAATIIFMPSSDSDASSSSWGSYSMPNTESPLQKRQSEKPLSEAFESAARATDVPPMSTPLTTFAEQSSPLRGILPACFRTQEECESTTRNCTGHGKCRKLYHDRDAAKGQKGDCYSCQCSATKEESEDGKVKTTVWGGPACQKQDVSVQFWLIALFTVGLIFLVSFAVGSVVSMGSEELPSVIGAGVSGPVRK